MDTYYENILVPVNDTLTTQKSVARAIGLASPGRSIIHLAQLIHTWNPFGRLTAPTAYEAGSKGALDSYIKTLLNLMRWKDLIEKQGHVAKVKIHIRRGPSLNLFIQIWHGERKSTLSLPHAIKQGNGCLALTLDLVTGSPGKRSAPY